MSNEGRFDHDVYAVVSTAAGPCGLLWRDDDAHAARLLRVYPAHPDRELLLRNIAKQHSTAQLRDGALPPWLEPVRRFLVDYYAGGNVKLAQLDWNWLKQHLFWQGQTEFTRAVLAATYKIKSGTTLSYGDVAQKVHRPRAARAVGGALARNPWPVLIPCHRVVGADGSMTGFSGYGSVATKKRMLAVEQQWLACR